jgi:uncharacterized phage infection (PIP) family protein YhgE
MDKKKLISEDLKRYKQLLEYTFYVSEDEPEDVNGNLLLDDEFLTEQEPEETETPEETTDVDSLEPSEPEETTEVDPLEPSEPEIEDEFAVEDVTSSEETVEVDVTDLVDKTDETKTTVDSVSTKMDELLNKLTELESQVGGMDQVINKIDELEKEIEKRNPTPIEKLEMRSMSSFPYSVKLTDFWQDREGYDTSEPEEEFTLTQSDVENFEEKEIRASFDSID